MELRKPNWPGVATYPQAALWPGIPLGDLDDPAGWITSNTGRAAPYALFTGLDQGRDRRATVVESLTGTVSFLLGAAKPGRPHWTFQFLVRTLDQVLYLDALLHESDRFTFTEWPGKDLTLIESSTIRANTVESSAAWYTLQIECVEDL